MSEPQNIIGIVKEIQRTHDSILAGSDLTEVAMQDMLHLWHHFPAIAEALLICVEALEKVRHEHSYHSGGCHGTVQNGDCSCQLMVAEDALSRIRNV